MFDDLVVIIYSEGYYSVRELQVHKEYIYFYGPLLLTRREYEEARSISNPSFRLTDFYQTEVNGLDAYRIAYTFTDEDGLIAVLEFYFQYNNHLYSVRAFTTPASHADEYFPIYDAIMDTFTLH